MMILPHDFVLYLTCDIVIDSKREERGKANPKKWWKRHQYVGHRIPSLTIISCVLLCTLERWYLLSCDTFLLVLENSKTRKKFEWKRCHKIIFIECNCRIANKVLCGTWRIYIKEGTNSNWKCYLIINNFRIKFIYKCIIYNK